MDIEFRRRKLFKNDKKYKYIKKLVLCGFSVLMVAIVTIPIAFAGDLKVPLKKLQEYETARPSLINAGWKPLKFKNRQEWLPSELPEIHYCQQGDGQCEIWLSDGFGKYLHLVTTNDGFAIRTWKIQKSAPEDAIIDNTDKTVAFSLSKSIDEKECRALLRIGMFNGILEDICKFSGDVKNKILNSYNVSGCKTILEQTTVDDMAKDILAETRGRYKDMGSKTFCNSNIEAYKALQ